MADISDPANGHGNSTNPDDEIALPVSLAPVPPLPEGEGYGRALREFHVKEGNAAFLEVAENSLDVARRDQFFSWLQGSFQYVFPHEVMICGIGDPDGENFSFDSFSSILYPECRAEAATSEHSGVVWRAMDMWQRERRPLMLGEGLLPGDYGDYLVPFTHGEANLGEVALTNIAAHGMEGLNGNISTFFCFSHLPQQPGKKHARLLELLVPYLHSALVRVKMRGGDVLVKKFTGREHEVLQWVKKGKTNGEIALILGISLYTVKNHVQSILRKLNAQNRSHAAAKSSHILAARVK